MMPARALRCAIRALLLLSVPPRRVLDALLDVLADALVDIGGRAAALAGADAVSGAAIASGIEQPISATSDIVATATRRWKCGLYASDVAGPPEQPPRREDAPGH